MEFLRSLYSAFDASKMQWFTFVPAWVIQDAIVFVLAAVVVGFILKREKHPGAVLLEIFCFIFLYAAVYENLSTVMGWYGFGRSLVMIFNVPATVPLIEALFVYVSLRFVGKLELPAWAAVAMVGAFGVLADLTLDPLALSQVHGGIGRWSWYIAPSDVNVFGVPIYNFTGWFLLCGYSSAFLLLGRYWHKKSGYSRVVGMLYPPLCMLAALLGMVSPLSAFLLWLGPFLSRGGWIEYVMLGLVFAALVAALLRWRGRIKQPLSLREDYGIPAVFGVFYLSNLLFAAIGGQWKILLFSLPFIAVHMAILWFAFRRSAGILAQTEKPPA